MRDTTSLEGSAPLTPLCHCCHALITGSDEAHAGEDEVLFTRHHSSLRELSESSSTCFMCEKLLEALNTHATLDGKLAVDCNPTGFLVSHQSIHQQLGYNHANYHGRWPKGLGFDVDGSRVAAPDLQILVVLDRKKPGE
jgi:hypothetical protein